MFRGPQLMLIMATLTDTLVSNHRLVRMGVVISSARLAVIMACFYNYFFIQ